jgi:hypothetical protein
MTEASGNEMTRAILVGIAASVGLHLIYIGLLQAFGVVGIIIAIVAPAAIGYLVGEAVYRTSGYTRNRRLAWVAAGSVIGGFALFTAVFGQQPIGLFGVLIGAYFAYSRVAP